MTGFAVAALEPLSLSRGEAIREMYALSPFVWKEDGGYSMLLRIVPNEPNPADKIARIHFGRSEDGLAFVIDDEPTIAPDPRSDDDRDGCEDPTVVMHNGEFHVYYTGWNQKREEGKLLLARGSSPRRLRKVGVALQSDQHRNPKEATVIAVAENDWRMFFEFAESDTSRIGVARADNVDGPWTVLPPLCAARPGRWDGWHVSTGPIWQPVGEPAVMFYNGANEQAHWRIGWLTFDESCTRIVDRADHPLIMPPAPEGDATDIAFAASCVSAGDGVHLYYSIADREMIRATLRAHWDRPAK